MAKKKPLRPKAISRTISKAKAELHFRTEWVGSRKALLLSVKRQVRRILGAPPAELARYHEDYDREFRSGFRQSSKPKLMRAVERAQIVLAGDFHAHSQSQRTHLRILRALSDRRPVVLALECVESQHQKLVDDFLEQRISEKTFLRRISWSTRWGFDWSLYRPIFEFAREKGHKIVALNKFDRARTGQSLSVRDRHAAKLLVRVHRENPESLIYVVFGDLHLAHQHLPSELRSCLKEIGAETVELLIIHQNSEKIYFDLAKTRREMRVSVVQLSTNVFCVQNSAPWLRWQAFLSYLEEQTHSDVGSADARNQAMMDTFVRVLRVIQSELEIECSLNDFDWCSFEEAKSHSVLKRLSGSAHQQVRSLLSVREGFLIPEARLLVVDRVSINHMAQLAGQYFLSKIGGLSRTLNPREEMCAIIWIEALSFFMSKLVNPQRPADTMTDLSRELKQGSRVQVDILKLCLSYSGFELHRLARRRTVEIYRPRHRSSYLLAARKLGALLGEQIFWGYRNGTIRRNVILSWLKVNVHDLGFEKFYFEQLKRIRAVPVVLRTKEERL